MSLNDVIEALGGSATYTVTRTAIGTSPNGRYLSGAVTTFPIVAAIEPIDGRDIEDLPAGQRGNEAIMIFTATPLLPIRPGFEADRIAYTPPGYEVSGELWEVTGVAVLDGIDGTHYEVTACRPPGAGGSVP